MTGGLGNDTYFLSVATDSIIEAAEEGTDTIKTDFSYTLLDNFETLILGGSGDLDGTGNAANNHITGTGGINTLSGLAGNDTLVGGSGADLMNGGEGADSMSGGSGADIYLVDDLGDRVIETSATQIDLVIASVSFTLTTGVENLDMLTGAIDGTGNSVANEITGNSADNNLVGSGGNDTLIGAAGADTLNGGTGNDTMIGGNGSDTYIVNSLTDTVTENGTGLDLVESSVSHILGANLENLTLTGVNNINATGNTVANILIGNAGVNKITGMEGDDTLTGGAGADRFVFNSVLDGADTITDYNGLVSGVADGDMVQFAASLLVGTFAYTGAAGFSGGDDNSEARIASGGRVIVDFNGDGAGDLTIFLTGLVNEDQLSAVDFAFL